MAVVPTPKVLRRRWGKLPLTPIHSSLRDTTTPHVATPVVRPAVIATDAHGVITGFNSVAEKLLGYSAEDLIGQATPEIFHAREELALRATRYSIELREPAASGFDALVARARHDLPSDEEWHFIRQDGAEIRVLASLTRLRDAHSHTLGYVITATQVH